MYLYMYKYMYIYLYIKLFLVVLFFATASQFADRKEAKKEM